LKQLQKNFFSILVDLTWNDSSNDFFRILVIFEEKQVKSGNSDFYFVESCDIGV